MKTLFAALVLSLAASHASARTFEEVWQDPEGSDAYRYTIGLADTHGINPGEPRTTVISTFSIAQIPTNVPAPGTADRIWFAFGVNTSTSALDQRIEPSLIGWTYRFYDSGMNVLTSTTVAPIQVEPKDWELGSWNSLYRQYYVEIPDEVRGLSNFNFRMTFDFTPGSRTTPDGVIYDSAFFYALSIHQIPEPSQYALLLGGLALIGAAARRGIKQG